MFKGWMEKRVSFDAYCGFVTRRFYGNVDLEELRCDAIFGCVIYDIRGIMMLSCIGCSFSMIRVITLE